MHLSDNTLFSHQKSYLKKTLFKCRTTRYFNSSNAWNSPMVFPVIFWQTTTTFYKFALIWKFFSYILTDHHHHHNLSKYIWLLMKDIHSSANVPKTCLKDLHIGTTFVKIHLQELLINTSLPKYILKIPMVVWPYHKIN